MEQTPGRGTPQTDYLAGTERGRAQCAGSHRPQTNRTEKGDTHVEYAHGKD